jgi:hypothetical protein
MYSDKCYFNPGLTVLNLTQIHIHNVRRFEEHRFQELMQRHHYLGALPKISETLRRFAVSVIKSKGVRSVAQKMRQLTRNVRSVFDYLRMTNNSVAHI